MKLLMALGRQYYHPSAATGLNQESEHHGWRHPVCASTCVLLQRGDGGVGLCG